MDNLIYPSLLYLIGMPASGKTTFGKQLAQQMNYNFIDTDDMLVKETGKSITDIFEQEGEKHFREVERKILLQTTSFQHTVVSTGGGAPCFYDNIEIINKAGYSIFLYADIKSLISRAMKNNSKRPMFFNKSEKEVSDLIKEKINEREKYYRQAHLTIDVNKIDLEKILSFLKKLYE